MLDKQHSDHSLNIQPPDRLTTRSIRSFVIRNGRTTSAQADAIRRLMPEWGLPYSTSSICIDRLFNRAAPLWLEIGFGNGDVLTKLAEQRPELNLLGIEVHSSGIGHALLSIEKKKLTNIRIIQHDAMEVMENMLPPECVDQLLLLFPDPWHKKRHHKRRIVQPDFVNATCRVLKAGGLMHCATDWEPYALWMVEHFEKDKRLVNSCAAGQPAQRPSWRPLTHFERRGQRLGHAVTDLLYRKL